MHYFLFPTTLSIKCKYISFYPYILCLKAIWANSLQNIIRPYSVKLHCHDIIKVVPPGPYSTVSFNYALKHFEWYRYIILKNVFFMVFFYDDSAMWENHNLTPYQNFPFVVKRLGPSTSRLIVDCSLFYTVLMAVFHPFKDPVTVTCVPWNIKLKALKRFFMNFLAFSHQL